MRFRLFMGLGVGIALSAAVPTAAYAKSSDDLGFNSAQDATRAAALKWEMAYLGLSALDAAQTIECLNRRCSEEKNPLFGKRPSSSKILLAKVGLAAVHFGIFSELNRRSPKTALRAAQISAGFQGSVVMFNARVLF